jgi:hypothetical protein
MVASFAGDHEIRRPGVKEKTIPPELLISFKPT